MTERFLCLYFGRRDECSECGGFNHTGHAWDALLDAYNAFLNAAHRPSPSL